MTPRDSLRIGPAPAAVSSDPGTEGILAFRSVTAGYGGPPVVWDVDLEVAGGEVVGLIGPNGSGKTTLVRVASRALQPERGRVLVAGRDPYVLGSRDAARLVAVVPQGMAPTFSFTALEMVLLGRAPYLSPWAGGGPEDFRLARAAMATAGVDGLGDRPVEELSGGEQQGVVLAQALAQEAPVLLLDEPTTHLDLRHVVAILATVRRLAAEGRGVLAVFHDLNLAGGWCDRLVALDGGRVVASGSPGEVITPALLRETYGVDAEVRIDRRTGRPAVTLAPR